MGEMKRLGKKKTVKTLRRLKEKYPDVKPQINTQKAELYLEEGSNSLDFERDVNRGLEILSETREVIAMEFKTDVEKDRNGKEYSWYSLAVLHNPKKSYQIQKILDRLDNLEKELKRFDVVNSRLRKAEFQLKQLMVRENRLQKEEREQKAKEEEERLEKEEIAFEKVKNTKDIWQDGYEDKKKKKKVS